LIEEQKGTESITVSMVVLQSRVSKIHIRTLLSFLLFDLCFACGLLSLAHGCTMMMGNDKQQKSAVARSTQREREIFFEWGRFTAFIRRYAL